MRFCWKPDFLDRIRALLLLLLMSGLLHISLMMPWFDYFCTVFNCITVLFVDFDTSTVENWHHTVKNLVGIVYQEKPRRLNSSTLLSKVLPILCNSACLRVQEWCVVPIVQAERAEARCRIEVTLANERRAETVLQSFGAATVLACQHSLTFLCKNLPKVFVSI